MVGGKRPKAARIGYDPWLHTPPQADALRKAAEQAGAELVAVEPNPIDAVWDDQPPAPSAAVVLHPERLAGESAGAKLKRIAAALDRRDGFRLRPACGRLGLQHQGPTSPIRRCPVMGLRAARGSPDALCGKRKLSNSVLRRAGRAGERRDACRAGKDLKALAAQGKKLLFDSATAPESWSRSIAAGGTAETAADPIALMKAKRRRIGARAAHLPDGAAIVEFLPGSRKKRRREN